MNDSIIRTLVEYRCYLRYENIGHFDINQCCLFGRTKSFTCSFGGSARAMRGASGIFIGRLMPC